MPSAIRSCPGHFDDVMRFWVLCQSYEKHWYFCFRNQLMWLIQVQVVNSDPLLWAVVLLSLRFLKLSKPLDCAWGLSHQCHSVVPSGTWKGLHLVFSVFGMLVRIRRRHGSFRCTQEFIANVLGSLSQVSSSLSSLQCFPLPWGVLFCSPARG